jgi:hypothetical protein
MPESNSPTTLAELMAEINSRYVFNPINYPALAHVPDDMRVAFIVSHSLHHVSKSHGKLATIVEAADHSGRPVNPEDAREGVLKLLLNGLKLASELGITPSQILAEVPKLLKSA